MIEIKPQEVCEKAGKGFMKNEMSMEFDAISNNESFARVAVAAFVTHLNPPWRNCPISRPQYPRR